MTPIDAVQSKTNGITTIFADGFLNENGRGTGEDASIETEQNIVDATSLLKVGLEMFRNGAQCDPASLLPLYPGEPEAVRVWKERQAPPK
jgi:hypothetical protein